MQIPGKTQHSILDFCSTKYGVISKIVVQKVKTTQKLFSLPSTDQITLTYMYILSLSRVALRFSFLYSQGMYLFFIHSS
jgi:hypothetical protein